MFLDEVVLKDECFHFAGDDSGFDSGDFFDHGDSLGGLIVFLKVVADAVAEVFCFSNIE